MRVSLLCNNIHTRTSTGKECSECNDDNRNDDEKSTTDDDDDDTDFEEKTTTAATSADAMLIDCWTREMTVEWRHLLAAAVVSRRM